MKQVRSYRVCISIAVAAAALAGLLVSARSAAAQSAGSGPPIVIAGDYILPAGVALDPRLNRVLVTDAAGHQVWYAQAGDFGSLTWYRFGYVADRTLPEALHGPQGIAVDKDGNVYVVDTFGGEVQLYRWSADAGQYIYDPAFVTGTRQVVDGVKINLPRDIAVGADCRVYLLDSGNGRILVADGPADVAWQVWREDRAWGNPYGLDVADDGSIYLADTDHHRIVHLPDPTGEESAVGAYGVGSGQFRFPRDVAVTPDGHLVVADTLNNRLVMLRPDGTDFRNLTAGMLLGSPQRVAVDAAGHIFAVDGDHRDLVAFVGTGVTPAFDPYMRDHDSDSGAEPSAPDALPESPDILVRYQPDVDLAEAGTLGLAAYAFQQPVVDRNNYVYIAVRNRGTLGGARLSARLFWVADAGAVMPFPSGWNGTGFFGSYTSETQNIPGNTIVIPYLPARSSSGVDSMTVVGPLVWRPPAPEYGGPASQLGNFLLLARLVHINDPTAGAPASASVLDQVRLSNNVAARFVRVVHDLQVIGVAPFLDLGGVDVGDTVTRTVEVKNIGDETLKVTGWSLSDATTFALRADAGPSPCKDAPVTLPPSGACSLRITFNPTLPRHWTSQLKISSNDGDLPEAVVSISGIGLDPDISVRPIPLDFGDVDVLSTAQRYVAIANVGTEDLHVSDIKLSTTSFGEWPFGLDLDPPSSRPCRSTTPTVAPGDECDVIVTFAPPFAPPVWLPEAWERQLDISSDDPETPLVQVSVSGNGQLANGRHVYVAPEAIDFGDVEIGIASTPQMVTIANYGTQDLHVRIVPIANLSFTSDLSGHGACTSFTPVLSPGSYCHFRVTFLPWVSGTARGGAVVLSDDPQHGQFTVSLVGRGK